ncbi:hypothetical protein BLGI_3216 [Brevibacillus laterosporus GI-9]|nr:hypothetical protein BLGI_3216 [Brevibacillus laterosporus GI-9]
MDSDFLFLFRTSFRILQSYMVMIYSTTYILVFGLYKKQKDSQMESPFVLPCFLAW